MTKRELFAKLLLLITTIIWGSSFFILKNTIDALPMFFTLAVRFSFGALIIGVAFVKRLIKTDIKTVLHGVALGLGLAAAYALQTLGLKETTPGKNAFLTTVYVILVPFAGWLVFKERPHLNNLVAAVLCVLGIGLVSLNGGFHVERGDILTLFSGVFFTVQIILIKKFRGDDAGAILFFELLTTAVAFRIVSIIAEGTDIKLGKEQWLPILYLGVMATGAAQLMQLVGQRNTTPSSASLILSLEAVFGVIFSIIFYRERVTPRLWAGFAVIFAAILISELNIKEIWSKIKSKGRP